MCNAAGTELLLKEELLLLKEGRIELTQKKNPTKTENKNPQTSLVFRDSCHNIRFGERLLTMNSLSVKYYLYASSGF